jgi:hypothetical protein
MKFVQVQAMLALIGGDALKAAFVQFDYRHADIKPGAALMTDGFRPLPTGLAKSKPIYPERMIGIDFYSFDVRKNLLR